MSDDDINHTDPMQPADDGSSTQSGGEVTGAYLTETDQPPSFEEFDDSGSATNDLDPIPLTAINDVPVRVQAVLGRARVTVGELIRMKSGMVLELDRRVGEPVDVFVNNRLVARGEVMLVDHSLGVTLTEIVRQDG